MAELSPSPSPGRLPPGSRWRPVVRYVARTARRTLAESVYLLIAPAAITVSMVMALAGGPPGAGPGPRPRRWPIVANALLVLPVSLGTWMVTVLWWLVGLAASTAVVRNPVEFHSIAGTVFGLLMLCVLPQVTRLCVAAQAGLGGQGRALRAEIAELYRRAAPGARPASRAAAVAGPAAVPGTAASRSAAAGPAAMASADAAALRRLERDIHDGPQQRLVRLAMDLGRAQHHFASQPDAAAAALADAIAQTQETLDELRALSRGIAPPVLTDRGLPAALAALAARSTIPAELDVAPLSRRLDPAAETAAYFVVAEALANAAKHSYARRCSIGLRHGQGTLRVWLSDDGIGGAALVKGHGLQGLDSRLQAAGGWLTVTSPDGGPTTVAAELPCR